MGNKRRPRALSAAWMIIAAIAIVGALVAGWQTPHAQADSLGTTWNESESGWSGQWLRRGDTATFDATWRAGSSTETAVLTMTVSGSKVTIHRVDSTAPYTGQTCDYTGTISGNSASGTYGCQWASGPFTWTATISSGSTAPASTAASTATPLHTATPSTQPASNASSSAATGPSSAAWAGCWASSFGNMWLTVNGNSVGGSYDYPGQPPYVKGQISGTVTGSSWSATYRDNYGTGPLQATLAANGQSWSGQFERPDGTTGGWSANLHPEITSSQACVPNGNATTSASGSTGTSGASGPTGTSGAGSPAGPSGASGGTSSSGGSSGAGGIGGSQPTGPSGAGASGGSATPSSSGGGSSSSSTGVSNGTPGGAPSGATSLGGIDLASYCKSGGGSVELSTDGIWYCQLSPDFFVVIRMDDACQWMYNNPAAFARQRTAGDPQSWTCFTSGGSATSTTGATATPTPSSTSSGTTGGSNLTALGPIDFDGWCTSIGYLGVSLDGSTINDWHCRANIDVNGVCRAQYPVQNAVASYTNFNDPNSWQCYAGSAQGNDLGGMDLSGYCQSQGFLGVRLDGGTINDWHCRSSIDVNSTCRSEYGRSDAVGRYSDLNNPQSWACYSTGAAGPTGPAGPSGGTGPSGSTGPSGGSPHPAPSTAPSAGATSCITPFPNPATALPQSGDQLGNIWSEAENPGWDGEWVRRSGTNTFDASWAHSGPVDATGVLTMTLTGNTVNIHRVDCTGPRAGTTCDYTGTFSTEAGQSLVSGTYTCQNDIGSMTWDATISGSGAPSTPTPPTVTPSPGATPGGQNASGWAGCWASSYGNMWLTVNGNAVSGPYDYPGQSPNPKGQVNGTVNGSSWSATYADSYGTGPLQATLAANGQSWSGQFQRPDGTTGGWSGTLHPEVTTQDACVPGSLPIGGTGSSGPSGPTGPTGSSGVGSPSPESGWPDPSKY
jgi:hypothetical protein